MNDRLKKIHLVSGLSLLAFMLMYFVSGFVFYNNWLFPDREPAISTNTIEIIIPDGLDNVALSTWLKAELGLDGQLRNVRPQDDGRVRFAWSLPGKSTTVMLAADRHSAEVGTAFNRLKATSIDYHFVHGYGNGLLWNLWALMLDLAAAGCLVFACSGIGIWATSRERDRWSWVMLAGGLTITFGTLFYYMVLM